MDIFVAVGSAVFVLALVLMLVAAASCLAALVFQFVPRLQGTFLAFTGSDLVHSLRWVPANLAYHYRRKPLAPPPEPILVIFALNPLREKQYLFGFNPEPLHRPTFGPNRSSAIKFDYNDTLAIKKTFQLADDLRLNLCLEFVGRMPSGFIPKDEDQRSRLARLFQPPDDIFGRPDVRGSETPPDYALLASRMARFQPR